MRGSRETAALVVWCYNRPSIIYRSLNDLFEDGAISLSIAESFGESTIVRSNKPREMSVMLLFCDEEVVVFLAFLDDDVFIVEEHVDCCRGVGIGDFLFVD